MGFKVFIPRREGTKFASITDKTIRIGTHFLDKIKHGACDLYYDEEECLIGVKPTANGHFKLTGRDVKQKAAIVTCATFLFSYKIARGRHPCKWDREKEMFIIDPKKSIKT